VIGGAKHAGQAGPPKTTEGQLRANGLILENTSEAADRTDYAAAELHDQPDIRRVQRLQHRYTAAGWALHPLIDDEFVACRWGLHRVLRGLRECELFLRTVSGGA
jgi:hypothetical protein